MPVLIIALALAASKVEVDEDPIEVRVPKLTEKNEVAIAEALPVIKQPASKAALHEAVQVCALLSADVGKLIAAAKEGASDSLDERLLAIADGYLGFGEWASAEKALNAVRSNAGVHERRGRALRAQKRFADAVTAYDRAFALAPSSKLAAKLHSTRTRAGDPKAADEAARRWAREHPRDVTFRRYLAAEYLKAGRNREA